MALTRYGEINVRFFFVLPLLPFDQGNYERSSTVLEILTFTVSWREK